MNEDLPGDPDDVPDDLRLGFWKTVLLLNLAGIGLALGAMLWFFERSPWALPVFGGGAAAALHAWVLYRRYAPRHRDEPYGGDREVGDEGTGDEKDRDDEGGGDGEDGDDRTG